MSIDEEWTAIGLSHSMTESVFSQPRRNGSAYPAGAGEAKRSLAGLGAEPDLELIGHPLLRHDVGLERASLHSSDAVALCEVTASALNTARLTGNFTAAERALAQLRRSLEDMSQTVERLRDPLWDVHMRLALDDKPLHLGPVIAEAVQEWALSRGGSDPCDLHLELPGDDLLLVGDRRQLTILMVTLCEILSGGGGDCSGVRLSLRRNEVSARAEIGLEVVRTGAADTSAQLALDTVTAALSRCRLIARMHSGELEAVGSGRALVSLGGLSRPADTVSATQAPAPDNRLSVRPEAHIVERDGRRIRLSWTEWQLFAFLWDHPGVTFSRVELATGAWGAQWANRRGEVEIYISRIRRKVEHDARHPRIIRTVRGLGYRLDRS